MRRISEPNRVWMVLAAALALASGCSSKAETDLDAASLKAGDGACQDLAVTSHPCLAGWCQNELGVGMPCTEAGGECLANDDGGAVLKAILCTASYSSDLQFCTRPCVDDEDCGSGAICRGDPESPKAGKGCILVACTGEGQPADAGNGDVPPPAEVSATDAGAGS